MSTSRGEGAAAHEIAALLPPDQLRFLFLRYRPNHAINFDPSGDTIPRLFDEFDRIADAVAGRPTRGELPPNSERIFALSLADPEADPTTEAARYRPPFGHLALLLQVPGPDIIERLAQEKGAALDEHEQNTALERVAAATAWLDSFAPDSARLTVHYDGLPLVDLSPGQKTFLARLAAAAREEEPISGEDWQSLIFDIAKQDGGRPADGFNAIYRAFLGRDNGPRAGWLLASLSQPFVLGRLEEAAA
jgi:lysyl-tRNA synthetase class 1